MRLINKTHTKVCYHASQIFKSLFYLHTSKFYYHCNTNSKKDFYFPTVSLIALSPNTKKLF